MATATMTTLAAAPSVADESDQYPFACSVQDFGLGQPIVDNADGAGVPVYEEDDNGDYDPETSPVVGYSRDCGADTRHWYYAVDTDGARHVIRDHGAAAPGGTIDDLMPDGTQVATITVDGAADVPYLIRHERGVLNRFIYSVSMLATADEVLDGDPTEPDRSLWNGRLLYQFQGGVAIGHTQGAYSDAGIAGQPDQLRRGYAVIYSTGTSAATHYNLLLGGRTAEQLKAHFVDTHGEPEYTIGIGGSGGAIQQYIYNQNVPDLLDGSIPQYSYPDMTTQTIHIGDCTLLERWMDQDAIPAGDEAWENWDNRPLFLGLNAIEGYVDDFPNSRGAQLQPLTRQTGSSECIEGWLGLAPLAMNPLYGDEYNWDLLGDQMDDVEKNHWADVAEVYGIDPDTGYARVPWDNVGVQYGLGALAAGEITPEQFLDANARAGTWKEASDFVQEGFPFFGNDIFGDFDMWSARNMLLSPDGGDTPAPRRDGDVAAIANAYSAGLVNMGDPQRRIPTIDSRPYLEGKLDMHNSHQSFAVRERLRLNSGNASNQLVWFVDAAADGSVPAEEQYYAEAMHVMEEWLGELDDPTAWASLAELRAAQPDDAVDRCFDVNGDEIARGSDVWSGIIDDAAPGDCTEAFDLYTTSRIEAGGPITGDVYKCRLMPVETAVAEGVYGSWSPTAAEVDRVATIFPDGVCDYGLRGVADPRAVVPEAVTVTGGTGTMTISEAEPGARLQVRAAGEVVMETTADESGTAVIDLPAGTYVAAQEPVLTSGEPSTTAVEYETRGLLSMPVVVTADEPGDEDGTENGSENGADDGAEGADGSESGTDDGSDKGADNGTDAGTDGGTAAGDAGGDDLPATGTTTGALVGVALVLLVLAGAVTVATRSRHVA